ncbi:CHAT domain-containing protein [Streptomyces sp. ID05-26A]|nr:CHAT domain-containing protein [Streptomyces sp. ID05-26A]
MSPVTYVNFKITVHDEQTLSVEADYSPILSRVPLGGDALTLLTIERLASWVASDPNCSRALLELLGKHLYRCVFGSKDSPVDGLLRAALNSLNAAGHRDSRLRLTLSFEPAASRLALCPWEFIYIDEHSGGYFIAAPSTGAQLVLTRFVPPPPKIVDSLEPPDRPLRILVIVSSSPPKMSDVTVEMLGPQLDKLRGPDVEVEVLSSPTMKDVEKRLGIGSATPWWPHILHLVGHGEMTKEGPHFAIRMDDETWRKRLAVSDERNLPKIEWIPLSKIRELFPEERLPRLVFLQSCQSGTSYRAFASGAEEFVRSGTPAAIAMQFDIENGEADYFAQQIYASLSVGHPIDDAVTAARIQLAKRSAPTSWNSRHFGTPLLFLQSRQAVILRRQSPAESSGGSREAGDESLPCPYRDDDDVKCRRRVRAGMDQCPKCLGSLQWCENRHPCMADDHICGTCRVPLPRAGQVPRSPVADRGVSDFD